MFRSLFLWLGRFYVSLHYKKNWEKGTPTADQFGPNPSRWANENSKGKMKFKAVSIYLNDKLSPVTIILQ